MGSDDSSRSLFGNYIHKYYYNASISDGYTLRLIREEIATNYKLSLQEALAAVKLQKGDIDRKLIYAHRRFIEPMLDYIVSDFERSRTAFNDVTIGAMVICDSADQAREMFEVFTELYANRTQPSSESADSVVDARPAPSPSHRATTSTHRGQVNTGALILHDVGTKEERKGWVEDFKAGKIDLLFVYNMLLTGFDARRLKKLYLGRIVREHNLLQALTRSTGPTKTFATATWWTLQTFAENSTRPTRLTSTNSKPS